MLSIKTKDAWFSDRDKGIAERRKCIPVVSDWQKWLDTLFAQVDVQSLVEQVLGGLEDE